MARRRVAALLPRGAPRRPGAASPGFQALDAAGLVRHYDDRPFLTPTGLAGRAADAAARRRADVRVPGRGQGRPQRPAGRARLPGRHRELVGRDGRRAGRRRPAGRRVQPRRRDAAPVGAVAVPDRAEPGRPRPPLERAGGRVRRGGARPVAAGRGPAPGPAPPEPAVQPAATWRWRRPARRSARRAGGSRSTPPQQVPAHPNLRSRRARRRPGTVPVDRLAPGSSRRRSDRRAPGLAGSMHRPIPEASPRSDRGRPTSPATSTCGSTGPTGAAGSPGWSRALEPRRHADDRRRPLRLLVRRPPARRRPDGRATACGPWPRSAPGRRADDPAGQPRRLARPVLRASAGRPVRAASRWSSRRTACGSTWSTATASGPRPAGRRDGEPRVPRRLPTPAGPAGRGGSTACSTWRTTQPPRRRRRNGTSPSSGGTPRARPRRVDLVVFGHVHTPLDDAESSAPAGRPRRLAQRSRATCRIDDSAARPLVVEPDPAPRPRSPTHPGTTETMPKFDHHLHTSRHSPDSVIDPLDLIDRAPRHRARRRGHHRARLPVGAPDELADLAGAGRRR